MARKRLGPERQQWKGIDANERAFGSVNNALVAIILNGVSGVSPEIPGEGWRMVSPEKADQYIARGQRVLADFESQEMAPGGARGRAQKWMDRTILDLRRLVSDAEAVRSGKKPQKQTPESYGELRKSLGVGEARRYPQPKLPPRQFVAPREGRGAAITREVAVPHPALVEQLAADVDALREARGLTFDQAYDAIVKPEWVREYEASGGDMIALGNRVINKAKSIGRARHPIMRAQGPRAEAPRTQWPDWMILESVEKGHGMSPQAKDRAFELIDLGYIDATGTWQLTAKGKRALTEQATRVDAREGHTVRDYLAIDTHDRPIAGPFKSYSDARQAAGTGGAVQFVPTGRKTSEAGDDHRERSLDRLYGHTRGRDPYPFPSDRDRGISGMYGPKSGGAGAPTLSRGARRPPERAPGVRRRAKRLVGGKK
jgi:hypothetical protein